jgi:hypothetical protein
MRFALSTAVLLGVALAAPAVHEDAANGMKASDLALDDAGYIDPVAIEKRDVGFSTIKEKSIMIRSNPIDMICRVTLAGLPPVLAMVITPLPAIPISRRGTCRTLRGDSKLVPQELPMITVLVAV